MTEGVADSLLRATPRHETIYRTWSEGGAGLLLTGNVQVDRDDLERPGNVAIDISDPRTTSPEARERLAAWARAGTTAGNHLWMQISHAGRQSPWYVTRRPRAPSAVQLKLLGNYANLPMKDIPFREALTRVFEIIRRHRITPPRDFTLMLKSLMTIESFATALDSEFQIIEHLKPLIAKWWLPDAVEFVDIHLARSPALTNARLFRIETGEVLAKRQAHRQRRGRPAPGLRLPLGRGLPVRAGPRAGPLRLSGRNHRSGPASVSARASVPARVTTPLRVRAAGRRPGGCLRLLRRRLHAAGHHGLDDIGIWADCSIFLENSRIFGLCGIFILNRIGQHFRQGIVLVGQCTC